MTEEEKKAQDSMIRQMVKKELATMLGEELVVIKATEYESLPKIPGWIARNSWGTLCFFETEPHRIDTLGTWECMESYHPLPKEMFPEITWESEPVEVELLIRKI